MSAEIANRPHRRTAAPRGRLTVWLLAVTAAGCGAAAVLFCWLFLLLAQGTRQASIDSWAAYLDGAGFVVGLSSFAAAAAFLVWQYRAVKDAKANTPERTLATPAMAVVWWFVPVAFLYMPYRIVRDLHHSVVPAHEAGDSLVAWWWGAWLLSWALFAVTWAFLSTASTVAGAYLLAALGLVYSLSLVAAAILGAKVVASISKAEGLATPRR